MNPIPSTRAASRRWPATQTMAVAGLIVAISVVFIGPAVAKGPESVTITGPDLDAVEMTLEAHADISGLMELTGLWFGSNTRLESPPQDLSDGTLGDEYTVVWVNSGPPALSVADRTIVQYLYPNAAGGPVIHTPLQPSLEGWGGSVIGWFRAPGELQHALSSAAVALEASKKVAGKARAADVAGPDGIAPPAAIAGSPPQPSTSGGVSIWPWAVLIAVVAAAALGRLRHRAEKGRV